MKSIDRVAVKVRAKEMIKDNLWTYWKPVVVIGLIEFLIGFVLGLIGSYIGTESTLYSILDLISTVAVIPFTAGQILYILNFVRNKEYDVKDIYTYFKKNMWGYIALALLVGLFTALWSMLFVIPGIIAAISYSMVNFIFVDNENMKAKEIIKASKDMMNGHKWDYFVFELSFFGWMLLVGVTFGLAAIYVVPYMTVSQTLYYEELKKLN